jgi:hypothetical protein
VSEANTQDWNFAREMADQLDADAGFVRGAGAGRDDDSIGLQSFDIIDSELVVAADLDIGTQFAQVLDKVVGKRVVVVEDEDHSGT